MVTMLVKREIRRNFKSFVVTSLICSLLAFYIISIAKNMGNDIQQILDIKLPQNLQAAFGMKGLNFSNAVHVFTLGFSYIYLFLSIYVANSFAVIMSKEFSDKTAEYLFSLPIKRFDAIVSKLTVVFSYLLLTVLLILLFSWISFSIHFPDGIDMKVISVMALAWLIGGLFFGSAAFLISSFNVSSRSTSFIAIGFVLGMYLLQILTQLSADMKFLKYISPFDWFKGSDIAFSGELKLEYCLISLVLSFICLYFGSRRFRRMDVLI